MTTTAKAQPGAQGAPREMPLHVGANGAVQGQWNLTQDSICDPVVLRVQPTHVMPIVFVPGIMGSNLRLKENKNPVWRLDTGLIGQPVGLLTTWAPRGPANRQEILHPDRVEVDPGGDVPNPADLYRARGWGEVAEGSYRAFLSALEEHLDGKHNAQDAIKSIQQVLQDHHNGKSKTPWRALRDLEEVGEEELKTLHAWRFPVYAFGYNWLDDNGVSAKRLLERIRQIVQENNKPDALGGLAGFHCSQVMLVTHSMGGLVARACAKLPGAEELIAGTLLGVMPTNGAAVAYRRCKVGMRDESYLASQVIGQSGQEVTAVFAQAPGALALLPTANYQPGWLEIAGPQFKRTLPEKDPYAEIYGTKNPWWTLVSEAWLSPEGSKNPLTWTDFKEFLDLAAKFHANLTPTDYHPNTIAYYGGALNNEDVVGRSRDLGKHPSFERVVWQMRQGTSPTGERTAPPPNPQQVFEAGHQDLRADGVKPEYVGGAVEWTYSGRTDNVVRQETSDWELWPSSQDSSGDGTVPASSGNAPVQCDKVRQVFRVAGIEHEGAYQNKTVQGLTFYALTKLLVRSKAFESRTNASCKA